MAVEPKRGCGYRKVGGTYLVGGAISVSCDRMPYPLDTCPVCGDGIKVGRGYTKINPYRFFGPHEVSWADSEGRSGKHICTDRIRPCPMCDPEDKVALLMNVGEKYYPTPEAFLEEGRRMGICKRIPHIPPELVVGETVVYLTHPKACEVREPIALQQAMAILEESGSSQPRLLEAEQKPSRRLGIFAAFVPQRIEQLIKESQATPEKLEELRKRGITPVLVPDGDPDHA